MGGGGASGSSGTPSNTSGQAVSYQPTAQPQADIGYQNLLGGFFGGLGPSFQGTFGGSPNMFSGTPGGVAYGYAQPFVGGAGSGTVTDPNNPSYQAALLASQQAAAGGSPYLLGAANLLQPYQGQAFDLGQWSTPGTLSGLTGTQDSLQQITQALGGSVAPQVASQYAAALANQGQGMSAAEGLSNQNTWALNQLMPQAYNESQWMSGDTSAAYPAALGYALGGAANLNQYANQILGTAFDPQQALYNQLQNQVSQQAQAADAAAGLGGSAYGASTVGNTLSNFDINWQNQQLARQAQGLSAAQPAYTAATQLPFAPTAAATQAYAAANQLPQSVMSQGGAIDQAVASLIQQSSALPGQVAGQYGGIGQQVGNLGLQQGQLGSLLQSLPFGAANQYASAVGQLPSLYSAGTSLAGLPLQAQTGNTSTALQAMGNLATLGNQQYAIPQQVANDLQSYLQLGQAASGLSGQLGALGLQENQMGLAGIGSALGAGSNLLFGNQGLSGALGLGNAGLLGSSGLFGGGGAAAGLGGLTAGTGALDVGGGGELASGLATSAVGAADAGGSAGGLASILPFAAS